MSKKLWQKVLVLNEFRKKELLEKKHADFISLLLKNSDPHNLEEELSEKQIKWLKWMYEGYVNNNWRKWNNKTEDL